MINLGSCWSSRSILFTFSLISAFVASSSAFCERCNKIQYMLKYLHLDVVLITLNYNLHVCSSGHVVRLEVSLTKKMVEFSNLLADFRYVKILICILFVYAVPWSNSGGCRWSGWCWRTRSSSCRTRWFSIPKCKVINTLKFSTQLNFWWIGIRAKHRKKSGVRTDKISTQNFLPLKLL